MGRQQHRAARAPFIALFLLPKAQAAPISCDLLQPLQHRAVPPQQRGKEPHWESLISPGNSHVVALSPLCRCRSQHRALGKPPRHQGKALPLQTEPALFAMPCRPFVARLWAGVGHSGLLPSHQHRASQSPSPTPGLTQTPLPGTAAVQLPLACVCGVEVIKPWVFVNRAQQK